MDASVGNIPLHAGQAGRERGFDGIEFVGKAVGLGGKSAIPSKKTLDLLRFEASRPPAHLGKLDSGKNET
jgi:hypothetical protein